MWAATGSAHHRPKKALSSKPGEKDAGQIRTKFCLFGIRVHGSTAQRTAHFSLGSRQQRHDDQGDTRQNNSGMLCSEVFLDPEIRCGFVNDVGSQSEKQTPTILSARLSFLYVRGYRSATLSLWFGQSERGQIPLN